MKAAKQDYFGKILQKIDIEIKFNRVPRNAQLGEQLAHEASWHDKLGML